MRIVLSGVRSDGTPLVLVRCACGHLEWIREEHVGRIIPHHKCGRAGRLEPQPTLAQADAPRRVAA